MSGHWNKRIRKSKKVIKDDTTCLDSISNEVIHIEVITLHILFHPKCCFPFFNQTSSHIFKKFQWFCNRSIPPRAVHFLFSVLLDLVRHLGEMIQLQISLQIPTRRTMCQKVQIQNEDGPFFYTFLISIRSWRLHISNLTIQSLRLVLRCRGFKATAAVWWTYYMSNINEKQCGSLTFKTLQNHHLTKLSLSRANARFNLTLKVWGGEDDALVCQSKGRGRITC